MPPPSPRFVNLPTPYLFFFPILLKVFQCSRKSNCKSIQIANQFRLDCIHIFMPCVFYLMLSCWCFFFLLKKFWELLFFLCPRGSRATYEFRIPCSDAGTRDRGPLPIFGRPYSNRGADSAHPLLLTPPIFFTFRHQCHAYKKVLYQLFLSERILTHCIVEWIKHIST